MIVMSWASNLNSGPSAANRASHAARRWLRISADAKTGEILSCSVSSSDPHGKNGAERSAA